ncbi:MAG: hypothetical protein SVY41_01815 [Candidatus Nanohaloarchaea archaeon]|nr:hypothetical protein [Candidatus Nanohaloarchaea archaeon]
MPQVNQVDIGKQPVGPGDQEYFALWEFGEDDVYAELQVSQPRNGGPVTRVELGWKTSLGHEAWLDGVDGGADAVEYDALLGGNPDILLESTSAYDESPVETTYLKYRFGEEGLENPDEVTLMNGEPPELYQVTWTRFHRAYQPQARVTFNPRVIDRHPDDLSLRNHLQQQIAVTAPQQDAAEISRVAAAVGNYLRDTDLAEYIESP